MSAYRFAMEISEDGGLQRCTAVRRPPSDAPLSRREVFRLWQDDAGFRSLFNETLANTPFDAFRWETPAVDQDSIERPFQFVLVNAPTLLRRADAVTFSQYFDSRGDGIVVFESLGKDATLVVPSPRTDDAAYSHLAAFIRQAPVSQKHALWAEVGRLMETRLAAEPIWLNTAGGGVFWLHVRLDSRPKYYSHAPYKARPSQARTLAAGVKPS